MQRVLGTASIKIIKSFTEVPVYTLITHSICFFNPKDTDVFGYNVHRVWGSRKGILRGVREQTGYHPISRVSQSHDASNNPGSPFRRSSMVLNRIAALGALRGSASFTTKQGTLLVY